MNRIRARHIFCVVTVLLGTTATLGAYALLGTSWSSSPIVMELQLGTSGALMDGSTSWGATAEGALATWNQSLSGVSFRVNRDSTASTTSRNGYNNVVWANDVYGTAFGRALAVTLVWHNGERTAESDVFINRAYSYNSYRGPYQSGVYDLRRVTLHEFGHVLGLDHPDDHGQVVSALMNSTAGDLDHLTADDVAGAQALYGGSSPTPTTGSSPGMAQGLTVSSVGSSVSLVWSAAASGGAPSTYVVEAGSATGLANLANFATGNVSTSYSAAGVGSGVYYLRVRARNTAGTSNASNEAVVTVGSGPCAGPPTAPANLMGGSSGSTVTLGWNAAGSNPTSYIVEAGSAPGLTNLANSDTGSLVPSLTAPGVGRGLYYVRVRGKNTCGLGAASNEVVVVVN